MTLFDVIVVGVLGLSTAFAVIRGATREAGTLACLAGAGAAGYFLAAPVLKLLKLKASLLTTGLTGGALAAVAFVGVYVGLHYGLKRLKLRGRARRADQIAGGVFGFVRGLALVGLGFLAYGYYLDEARRPAAVDKALTLPLAQSAANAFENLAPPETEIDRDGAAALGENAAIEGYRRSDRTGLSELVSTVTTSDGAPGSGAAASPVRDADPIATAVRELDPE